ncbi:hypothetical protein DWF00_04060 [Bosea caraganae]|uniref:Uncharacterized protein n=1 Tax=Bosea caraganae TaxID=2763117 RepID=A0A370L5E1_9HYPH|nr:hypothetical protein [Bosea caraganae]RDJ24263.1 hypothetical protein DWE98_15290 [Bosea caraganae]RDJ30305.1 hypothetical protein DWF00_04060 [Bosea caraganae]
MDDGISALRHKNPPAKDILTALEAVLACDTLRLSERNRRFLSFVVAQTVSGNGERIKAYSIGVDVFGRDDTFDPTLDPIVRIEATRIRSALTAYYEQKGAGDRVRIAIPPGSYVPTFSWARRDAGARIKRLPISERQVVRAEAATMIINDRTSRADPDVASRGELFADALVGLLRKARFKVHVVPSAEHRAALDAIHEVFSHPKDAYSLDIAVRPMVAHRRYSWRLSDLRNGEILASDSRDYVVAPAPCFDLIDALAGDAADAIASAVSDR